MRFVNEYEKGLRGHEMLVTILPPFYYLEKYEIGLVKTRN